MVLPKSSMILGDEEQLVTAQDSMSQQSHAWGCPGGGFHPQPHSSPALALYLPSSASEIWGRGSVAPLCFAAHSTLG